ncbi:MAG TPA: type I secretion system permease/ATPase [Caulobacteraceae bacterium]
MKALPSTGARATPLDRAMRSLRPAIVVAIFFSLFINVLALVSPIYMLQIYDRVLSSKNVMTLLFITVIAVFLFVVYAMLEALRTQVLVRAGIRFDGEVRGPVFKSVLEGTLTGRGSGPQAFRDVDIIREFMTGAGLISFCDAPWIPVFIFVCFVLHPFFGVLAILAGLLILGLAGWNDLATRVPLQRATVASIGAQGDASTTMRNAEVMHAMGMWRGLQRRWELRRDDLIAWQASASDRGGGIMASIKLVRQVVQTLILGGGAYLAITGKISAGAMIAASILVGRALAPIEQAVGQWKHFIAARDAWDRTQATFRSAESGDPRMPLPAPKGKLSSEAATIVPPGGGRPVVFGVTFAMEPGTTLGIIGPSAAGKSSLMRGIVGVWPVATGAIKIDGFDLRQWDPLQLGQYIGYLPQDVELFSGTVADNIARFSDFKVDEVIEAARIAGVHEMIQALPNGYDTQIGEGGTSLSAGQRQRLALARTLFRRPPLLVLDEPNASLDAVGEQALAQALAYMKRTTTIIFSTHKTNLLGLADKIMLLQNGQVAQFGDRDGVLVPLIEAGRPSAGAKAPGS